jgi:hypothetical protein
MSGKKMSDGKMSATRDAMFWNKLAVLSLPAQAGLTTALLCGLWIALAPVAYQIAGPMGLVAEALGAGLCLFGALLGLAIGAAFPGSAGVLKRMFFSMSTRTVLPLMVGVALHFKSPELARAGLIYYLLVFYMATLAIETTLLLAQVSRTQGSEKSI